MQESHSNTPGFIDLEDILISFSLSLLEKKNEQEVIWSLVNDCISAMNFEDCVIYFVNHDAQSLVQKAAYGPKNPDGTQILSPLSIPLGKGITGSVAVSGEPIIVSDTSIDQRYIVDDAERMSEICVPIKIDKEIIGVIDCEHSQKNFFNEEHLRVLTVISKICAIKLGQLRAEQLRKEQMEETHRIKLQLAQLQTKMLKSHLNPHFVFNTLNSIQYFLTENKKEPALKYLTIFSKILRYYLANFENSLVFFHQEVEALENYLTLHKLRYGSDFIYTVNRPDISVLQESQMPPLLLIAMADDILENHLSENVPLTLQVSSGTESGRMTLSLVYEYADEQRTSSGYRKNMISWEDQISYFNEMRMLKITHELKSEQLASNKVRCTLKISIPQ